MLVLHPDPLRIPVIRGETDAVPLPEDVEINELLLEAHTLNQIYDQPFAVLIKPQPLNVKGA